MQHLQAGICKLTRGGGGAGAGQVRTRGGGGAGRLRIGGGAEAGDNVTLEDYKTSLPFVQRILNSNHSDRLKISSSQLLFGNVLKLDRGIF